MIISFWGINFLYLFQLTMCNVIVCNVGLVSIQSLHIGLMGLICDTVGDTIICLKVV